MKRKETRSQKESVNLIVKLTKDCMPMNPKLNHDKWNEFSKQH